MRAIILAAGQGTRLRPLTDDRPKCMVELEGKPLLEHQLEVLRGAGIEDIHVVGGYRAEWLQQEIFGHLRRYCSKPTPAPSPSSPL
ncbi:sugar phosphate nucleotidyltransferase [Halorhodospira halochloris]|uniref:sugar phosphate nucleotidyltransferase n=1 Tax=Halorhodospira halochloris TaxID=1052 RepID=UPI00076F8447|nr:sugar phosphate nucleotidyltransferase [Halorhodospira halochloris]MBK1652709.1 hypothetical protein [Halorhodospira halochloris]